MAAEGQGRESAVRMGLGLDLPAVHELCAGLTVRVPSRRIPVLEG